MALKPESIKPIKEFESKIDGMLLSKTQDAEGKTFEICLSSNEIPSDIRETLIAMYYEAGWRRVFFKADNITFVLNKS